MATEKELEFENLSIDNTDIFIRDVPKGIAMAMAKLIFPSIQEYFEKQD